MREVAVRAMSIASIVAAVALGVVAAQVEFEPQPRPPRPSPQVVRPPAATKAFVPRREASPAAAAKSSKSVDASTSVAEVEMHAAPIAPDTRGEGEAVQDFASGADWKVLYEPPDDVRDAFVRSDALRARLARDHAEAKAVEGALGPPPWNDAVFQGAGLADGFVAVAGRDFRARASPEASAAWYAARAQMETADPRVVAATDRLARFEAERAGLVARVLDRVAELAPNYVDSDVAAYFLAAGRVHLIRTSACPRAAELVALESHLRQEIHRRAEEICR